MQVWPHNGLKMDYQEDNETLSELGRLGVTLDDLVKLCDNGVAEPPTA